MRGKALPIKVYASDPSSLVFVPWNMLQSLSFLPSVSHAGENSTYHGLYIRSLFILLCHPHLTKSLLLSFALPRPTLLLLAFTRFAFLSRAKSILGGEHFKRIVVFPHFSHGVLKGLLRLVWGWRVSLFSAAVGVSQSIQEVGFYQPWP